MTKKSIILAAVLLSSFGLLIGFFVGGLGKNPQELPSVLTGRPLPAIDHPNLDASARLTNQDLPHGTPYLINIWGTWCPACLAEHPYLLQLKNAVPIIGINWAADNPNEAQDASQFLARYGNPYQLVIRDSDGSLVTDLGVYGAPETFLISPDGKILLRHAGALTPEIWAEKFQPLITASRANHES